jgi:hypothetical protein
MKALIVITDNRLKAWIKQDTNLTPLLFNGKDEWVFEENLNHRDNFDKENDSSYTVSPFNLLSASVWDDSSQHKDAKEAHLQQVYLALEKSLASFIASNLGAPITTTLIYPSALSAATLALIKKQFSLLFSIEREEEWSYLAAENYFNQSNATEKTSIIIDWQGEDLAFALASKQESAPTLAAQKMIALHGFSPMVIAIAQYIIFLYKQNRGNIPFNNRNPEFCVLLRNVQKLYASLQKEEQTFVRGKILFPHDAEPFTFNLEKNELYRSTLIKDTISAILQDQMEAIISLLESAKLKLKEIGRLVIIGSPSKSEFFEKHILEYEPSLTIQYLEPAELPQLALNWRLPIASAQTGARPNVSQAPPLDIPTNKTAFCKKVKQIATKNMEVGAKISLYWQPSRGVHLKVLSKGDFFAHLEVLEIIGASANMKVNDILRVSLELRVERYLETDLIRSNQNLGVYRSGTPLTGIDIWEEKELVKNK